MKHILTKMANMKLQSRLTLLVFGVITIVLLISELLISNKITSLSMNHMKENAFQIAHIVADTPQVVEGLKNPSESEKIQSFTEKITKSTKVEFIVVADMSGIRKSHPNEKNIGKKIVGNDFNKALQGSEYVSTAKGTLGESLRIFVPIYDNHNGKQIGIVVVGMLLNKVDQNIAHSKAAIFPGIVLGLLIGIIGAVVLAKSIKKTMFDLEPSEIAKLVEERSAMLNSIRDGVIAIDGNSRITLVSEEANRILKMAGICSPLGKKAEECIPNTRLEDVLKTGQSSFDKEQDINGIKILTSRLPILVNGKIVGAIATFRDKTEIRLLAEQLTGVKQYANALRAQTHEFKNKLHIILGMLHMKAYDQLSVYINLIANMYQEQIGFIIGKIKDPVLAGFIIGKMSVASENNIKLQLTEDSYIPEPEDPHLTNEIVTILGNLIQNAIEAAKDSKEKIVTLTLLYDKNDGSLTIEVNDSGPGFSDEIKDKLFTLGYSTKGGNRGIGLHLVQESVDRWGGKIDIFSELGKGTVFSIILPYESRDD
nr:DcuS/MalK family sensor histidine kinase [uncultured Bacillus sp.]